MTSYAVLAFTPKAAPVTKLITSATPAGVTKALEKQEASTIAKNVLRTNESGEKYSAQGLSFALFMDYHSSLETALQDHAATNEAFSAALELYHDPTLFYYTELNTKLFNVIWSTTKLDARKQIKPFYKTKDGRRALLHLYYDFVGFHRKYEADNMN